MEPRDPRDLPPEDGATEVIRAEEEVVYEEERPPAGPPPWLRENWWVPLLALLLVVGALLAFAFLRGGDDEDKVVVPDVVGLQQPEAEARLADAGLEAQAEQLETTDPAGQVIAQEPGAGSQLEEGQTVLLSVSTGEEEQTETETTETETETEPAETEPTETQTETETVTETETQTETVVEEPVRTQMPDTAGQDFRDAANAIADAGLLPTSYAVNSDEPQGTVLAQNPASGTALDEGTVVRINVSLGPGRRSDAEIPDVTGPEAAEALRTCHGIGFTCRVVERRAPDAEARGKVIDQEPAAGTAALSLTQITLYVGR